RSPPPVAPRLGWRGLDPPSIPETSTPSVERHLLPLKYMIYIGAVMQRGNHAIRQLTRCRRPVKAWIIVRSGRELAPFSGENSTKVRSKSESWYDGRLKPSSSQSRNDCRYHYQP